MWEKKNVIPLKHCSTARLLSSRFFRQRYGFFPFEYACLADHIRGHVPGHRNRTVFPYGQIITSQYQLAGVLLLVSPAISLIAVTLIVRGSAKAQSVEESQQVAVFLLLPLLLLIVGQFTGVLLMNVWILLGLGVVCAVLAWILLQKSMGRFTYEKLLQ